MSEMLWFVIAAVITIVIVLFLAFFAIAYLRSKGPHSMKMAKEQAQLNKKPGAGAGTPAVAPATANTGTSTTTPLTDKPGWFTKNQRILWSILLILAGMAIVFYFGSHISSLEAPSPKAVWVWTKFHWLWILLAGCALYFLTYSIPKERNGFAGTSRGVIVLAGIALFVAIPLVDLIWGDERPSQQAQQACSPISDAKVHRCVLDERPQVFTTERLAYSEALEFCIVRPTGTSYESKKVGPNSFEVRSASGTFPIEYKLLRGNCPDKF